MPHTSDNSPETFSTFAIRVQIVHPIMDGAYPKNHIKHDANNLIGEHQLLKKIK